MSKRKLEPAEEQRRTLIVINTYLIVTAIVAIILAVLNSCPK